jgi:cupin 2 domain-containing protein
MPQNLFAAIPSDLPEELIETLVESGVVRVERIVSAGHASPMGFWYDQPQHEWVVVLRGAARIQFEDERVELRPGDWINIPAHRRHRVEWTTPDEPTVWLAVHCLSPGDQVATLSRKGRA